MSTLLDYQRPSWYVLRCFSPGAHLLFSLNNIPKVSITRTILMNWLKHIDKGVFIFGIFQFFCLWIGTFYSAVVFEIPGAHPPPPPSGGCWYVQHTWYLARTNFDAIFGEEQQVLSASSRALYHCVHNYASPQTAVAYWPIPNRAWGDASGLNCKYFLERLRYYPSIPNIPSCARVSKSVRMSQKCH